jgi:diguanylate cyclase (GGDEF)-like protein
MATERVSSSRKMNNSHLNGKVSKQFFEKNRYEPKKISFQISAIYLAVGSLWILMSDKIVSFLVSEKEMMIYVSIIKGWVYVVVTGLLIYGLVHSALKRVKDAEAELVSSYRELSSANDEIASAYGQLAASEELLRQQYDEILKTQQQLSESEARYQKRLRYLAYHDRLTGLKNGVALTESLKTLLNEENKKIAVLYVDIDNFKYVNDTMGHTFGDLILKEIGERLEQMQNNNASIYRLSGDEFIIVYDCFEERNQVENIAVKILKELKRPIVIEGSSVFITVSVGISVYPEHGTDMDELLKNADIAVYKAKEAGKNKIVIYNEPMNEAVIERMRIEKNLRTALDNNEFELYYQPQLDIRTNKISGFEALIRWRNSELGIVSPEKFIGVAEDTHLIIPIGEWVFRNASIFLRRLHQYGYTDLTVSINVSMLQLLQDDFVDIVFDTIELVKVNPKNIEIEITESILMESYEAIAGKLKLLQARGIRIALDDFGKGYSSLHYLRHLPISTLKIDKTFVDTISINGKNKSLTDLIVRIGRSMDLCVVAEGVETQEQMKYLIKHKCHKIQGYIFSKPLSERSAITKLKGEQNECI